jgi:hypothetical protein
MTYDSHFMDGVNGRMSDREPDRKDSRQPDADDDPNAEAQRRLTLAQIIGSTLAAGFGVQKRANRERDFRYGRPAQFITAGIIFTVLFVLAAVVVVRLVLQAAGA